MTISRDTLSHIRFGYGFRPESGSLGGADGLMAQVRADVAPPLSYGLQKRRVLFARFRTAARKERDKEITNEELQVIKTEMDELVVSDFTDIMVTQLTSKSGFVARLAAFWADHFTIRAEGRRLSLLHGAFVPQAIRPHINGNFADMLIAVATHPGMLVYLDQNTSMGPNSVVGKLRGRGLNENLAREILELHTLGVGSGYSQTDVREFAELLTGLRLSDEGVSFRYIFAEPGPETVLGVEYGADYGEDGLDTIKNALRDLAVRPETARHIASKLVTHFVDDVPDPALVDHVAAAYLQNGGNLVATYEALLAHDAAWVPELRKVKLPQDYVVSALRAFGFEPGFLRDLTVREMRQSIWQPMTAMGQTPNQPLGPDGWPEEATAWITPATLAARIDWATELARQYGQNLDPRLFLETALGDAASQNTRFLVAGSESKWEGVALALASPEFNRR